MIVYEKEAVMIHIGTVHVNGREYNLELNRATQPRNDSRPETGSATARRNFPTSREVFLLNPNRKQVAAQSTARQAATVRAIDDLRRVAELRRKEQSPPLAAALHWKVDGDKAVKLVSRFLSWCFPVREFKSPLQRVLYLSIEKPKAKYRSRYLLP
jgi:hypothetical protein